MNEPLGEYLGAHPEQMAIWFLFCALFASNPFFGVLFLVSAIYGTEKVKDSVEEKSKEKKAERERERDHKRSGQVSKGASPRDPWPKSVKGPAKGNKRESPFTPPAHGG